MKEEMKTIVKSIQNAIIKDINNIYSKKGCYDVLEMLLKAYNDYQESERDGVDYIFNINDTNDLKCCIDGGMTAKEIGELYSGSIHNHSQYFYFGCNHPKPEPINSLADLRCNLVCWLDELIPSILAYPYAYESYKAIYEAYMSDIWSNL